ncbi:hypothetical protein PROFUN_05632 [Planoprotostelium fungivorum]|uniref:LamG-like jellyroll fold domain-containing protein n=1 Tax=Planoprotostelium fungivorum TaxID=1890364 RepID=A0A2P6MUC3_9EUKA|nr:hypothetical protein PROFUN_05632 [Planoprotostelium fungivorum]
MYGSIDGSQTEATVYIVGTAHVSRIYIFLAGGRSTKVHSGRCFARISPLMRLVTRLRNISSPRLPHVMIPRMGQLYPEVSKLTGRGSAEADVTPSSLKQPSEDIIPNDTYLRATHKDNDHHPLTITMKHAFTLLFLALTTAAHADSVAASASATNVVIPSSPVEPPIYFTPAANYLQKQCGLPWLYWSFDNTKDKRCTDDSGHGRHGTFNTNASIVTGKLRRGCDWKSNSLFFITLPQFTLEQFTVATWLRLDSKQGENIIASTKGWYDGWELSLDGKTNVITFQSSRRDSVQWKPDSLPLETWFHLAITVSPNRVELYLNGVSSGPKAIVQIVRSGSSLSVGRKLRADPFRGALDEFLIFDRLLDKEEIMDALSKFRSGTLVTKTNWSKQTNSYEWGARWELDTKQLTAVRMDRLKHWWIF